MDERGAGLRRNAIRGRLAGYVRRLAWNHFGALPLDRLSFDLDGVVRNHDVRGYAAQLCGTRDRGAVISRRMGNDAAACLLVAQQEHRIGCAPGFEGTDLLQVLAFEEKA